MNHEVESLILKIINESNEPLETKEVIDRVSSITNVTRSIAFHRLSVMRGDGKVKGKFVGPGKGVWIWWRNDLFE